MRIDELMSDEVQKRSKPRLPLFALLLAVVFVAAGSAYVYVKAKTKHADELVGTWRYQMFTGELVIVDFNQDGTYTRQYVEDGVVRPFSIATTKERWESDGNTLAFYAPEAGLVGRARNLFGYRHEDLDQWEILSTTDVELVLGKPGSEIGLVMTRADEEVGVVSGD